MTRSPLRLALVPGLLVFVATAFAGSSWARSNGGPFYVPPSKTHECAKLPYCYGITAPWIVIPAHGVATFLFGCPAQAKGKYLLAGTDSLASSKSVRVWYDGQLGTPIGHQTVGSALLFHATTNNGGEASFQPVVGCINLVQAGKRSTVSARVSSAPPPGTPRSAPSLRPRATSLILEPGWTRSATVSCTKKESLVGSWSAVGFGTSGPPRLPTPNAIRISTHQSDKTVLAVIRTSTSIPYLIHVQVGALCQP
jgi:hypothetical protein